MTAINSTGGDPLSIRIKKIYPHGDTYEGECVDGQAHGFGKYVYATGGMYEGQWMNGTEHGYGK